MNKIKYIGGCDVIRSNNFQWGPFQENELIIGKDYEIIDTWCAQTVWILENGKPKQDFSGTRYRYYKVLNEQGNPIYVWDGFFEGDTL